MCVLFYRKNPTIIIQYSSAEEIKKELFGNNIFNNNKNIYQGQMLIVTEVPIVNILYFDNSAADPFISHLFIK